MVVDCFAMFRIEFHHLPRSLAAEQSAAWVALPVVPELDGPDAATWVVQDTWRDIPYDYATLLENVMDVSHVRAHLTACGMIGSNLLSFGLFRGPSVHNVCFCCCSSQL
jgi:hypothetical protein